MGLKSWIRFGVIWATASAAPSVAGAYCAGWDTSLPHYDPNYYAVPQEFRRAKYVVKATVVQETWVGEDGEPKSLEPPFQNNGARPWGLDPYAGVYYRLKVGTVFKGRPPPDLTIFSENSTARFWFKVGSEQVLFVTEQTFDDRIGERLTMDTCGNSAALPKARRLMKALRALSPKSARHAPMPG